MIMITNKPAVGIHNVSFTRDNRPVFKNFSLDIPKGQYLAVLGTNGAGKSTLLDLITGLLTAQQGTVTRHEKQHAFVPQRSTLNEHIPMTVWNTVAMGRWTNARFLSRVSRTERVLIDQRIDQLGLTDLVNEQIPRLSGGQRQRVLLAQALVQEAPLILLDEPEAGLDGSARNTILDALDEEAAQGTTIVITTHELDSARRAERCVLLQGDAAGIVADGPPNKVLTDASLAKAFG